MGKIGFSKGVNPTSTKAIQAKMEARPDARMNAEGGTAFDVIDPSIRLLKMASGSFFNEEQFYDREQDANGLTGNAKALIDTAVEIANRQDGFASDLVKIAAWLRDPINGAKIRLTPQVLMAVAAREYGTKPFVRKYIPKVIQRVDELRTMFAAYQALYGDTGNREGRKTTHKFTMPPNCMKRGLMDAACKFGEKDYAKYDSRKMRPFFSDVLRAIDLTKNGREQGWNKYLWFYLLNGLEIYEDNEGRMFGSKEAAKRYYEKHDLKNKRLTKVDAEKVLPVMAAREKVFKCKDFAELDYKLLDKAGVTWENLTSQFGSNPVVWEFALHRMGYMALVKNLRNLSEAGLSDKGHETLFNKLTNSEAVAKSRLLPFRFWTAYKMLGGAMNYDGGYGYSRSRKSVSIKDSKVTKDRILEGLVIALDKAVEALPEIPGTTAIALDLSGSMSSATVSKESVVTNLEAAAIMAAIVAKKSERSIVIGFGESAQYRRLSKIDSTMTNMEKAANNGGVGHSTNGYLAPMMLNEAKTKVDRLILISDEQLWDSSGRMMGGYGYNRTSLATEWMKYKKAINPDAWIHILNIGGSTLTCTPLEGKVNLLGGFSEQVLPMCLGAEAGAKAEEKAAMVEEDENNISETTVVEPLAKTEIPAIEWIRANY